MNEWTISAGTLVVLSLCLIGGIHGLDLDEGLYRCDVSASLNSIISDIQDYSKEDTEYLYDSLIVLYDNIKADSADVAQNHPNSEYAQALLWLAHDYTEFAIREYVIVKRMLGILKDIFVSIMDGSNNPTANQAAGDSQLPILDKGE